MISFSLNSRGQALLITLAAAGMLLFLGVEWGISLKKEELQKVRQEAAAQATRANRLTAEMRTLEKRLAKARAGSRREGPPADPPRPKGFPAKTSSHLLHKGQALVLLSGRLVVALEDVSHGRRRAAVKVRAQGRERTAVVGPGSEVTFRLDKERWRLLVKQIYTASIRVALLRQ